MSPAPRRRRRKTPRPTREVKTSTPFALASSNDNLTPEEKRCAERGRHDFVMAPEDPSVDVCSVCDVRRF